MGSLGGTQFSHSSLICLQKCGQDLGWVSEKDNQLPSPKNINPKEQIKSNKTPPPVLMQSDDKQ